MNSSQATTSEDGVRISPEDFRRFALRVFEELGVPGQTAELACQSLIEASLVGVDSHGIEALEMYVNHLKAGGLKADRGPTVIGGMGSFEIWDMRSGFGLASARLIMRRLIDQARESGIAMATVRNTNHIGACGIYGKMAADQGMIGMVSQETVPCLSPWGGKTACIGSSPFAFVAPVEGEFPFYFDCQMASMTRAQVKAHRLSGTPLPEGAALDSDGHPTTDAEKAWFGQLMPIGRHKGVGLAMVFEILSGVLSGNGFSPDIPSIVNEPDKSADSSVFMIVFNPAAVYLEGDFSRRMKEYVEMIEASPAIDPANPPRYPGRREGLIWRERSEKGIPIGPSGMERFQKIASDLNIPLF
jgi:LDH2 family malate/lactate/ureidoglycolate dehydrogenase